jgi:hypothetical protein
VLLDPIIAAFEPTRVDLGRARALASRPGVVA